MKNLKERNYRYHLLNSPALFTCKKEIFISYTGHIRTFAPRETLFEFPRVLNKIIRCSAAMIYNVYRTWIIRKYKLPKVSSAGQEFLSLLSRTTDNRPVLPFSLCISRVFFSLSPRLAHYHACIIVCAGRCIQRGTKAALLRGNWRRKLFFSFANER